MAYRTKEQVISIAEKVSLLLACSGNYSGNSKQEIINYIIADESRDKRSQFLSELTISKSYLKHYLWLLTNDMLVLLETLAPTKAIFTW